MSQGLINITWCKHPFQTAYIIWKNSWLVYLFLSLPDCALSAWAIKAAYGWLCHVMKPLKSHNPQLTGKSHALSSCLRVSKKLCGLSCASPVSLAVLIKHISGRWLQLKDTFTDDTVQKDEERFRRRGRGAGMPSALRTAHHKIDASAKGSWKRNSARHPHPKAAHEILVPRSNKTFYHFRHIA